MINLTRVTSCFFLVLALFACETQPTKTELSVRTSVSALDFGDTLRISLTNESGSEIYFDLDCFGIERRSGKTWLTPESLVKGCIPLNTTKTALASGATVSRAIPVWDAQNLGADVLGSFRIRFSYRRERNFDATSYQAVSNEFTVR